MWPFGKCKAGVIGNPTRPETYLRLAWERALLSADGHGNARLADAPVAGRALVAAGVLDEAMVLGVRDEYLAALRMRADNMALHLTMMRSATGKCRQLSAARVAFGDFEIGEQPGQLVVQQVTFADDAVHLELYGRTSGRAASVPPGPLARTGGGHWPRHPLALTVTDDKGRTATANPGRSSSSDRNWEGIFSTAQALSATTEWLEINGVRVDLPPPAPLPEARVEKTEQLPRLKAALYAEVVASLTQRGPGETVQDAERALLETGALAPDDPLLAEVDMVRAALNGSGKAPSGLPEPWASLLGRLSSSDGPVGRIPVGAAFGSIDGYSVRFDSLASEPHKFVVAVAASPGDAFGHRLPGMGTEPAPLQWWAEDDRHNMYLGSQENYGSSDDLAQGNIGFTGPLDPKARRLSLLPTGRSERGVVSVPLDGLTGLS